MVGLTRAMRDTWGDLPAILDHLAPIVWSAADRIARPVEAAVGNAAAAFVWGRAGRE